MHELARLTAAAMLDGFRQRTFTPVDVLDDVIAAFATTQARCNVIVTDCFAAARVQALAATRAWQDDSPTGALCGVPVTIKDLIYMEGVRAMAGMPVMRDFVAPVDGAPVSRLRSAGAILTCKTTTCESGYKLTADSPVSGITRNPWNLSRTSGGSSGGAAAAVAAGCGPLALGTDAVGSIRIPASFCGVVGIKGTFGLVPRAPGFSPPGWGSLAHTGPIGRSVDDVALMLSVIAGYDARDGASLPVGATDYLDGIERGVKGLRIAFSPDFGYAAVDPAVAAAIERAAAVFERLGAQVVPSTVALASGTLEKILKPIGFTEQATSVAGRTEAELALSEPEFRATVVQGKSYSGVDYMRATHLRAALREVFRKQFESVDLIISPTVAVTAFAAGTLGVDSVAGVTVDRHVGWSPFSYPLNLAGLPAASVPCGFDTEGLPIGLQIIGPWLGEKVILRAARAFEEAQPWAQTWPAI
ncbi:MAG: amidase [Herminiimonas sp.]|nr:amidase [Herminiimonas sp.]